MFEISLFPYGKDDPSKTREARAQDIYGTDDLAKIIRTYAWAPGLFKDDTRSNKGLESINLLVLDVDEGCSLADALKTFAPYKHVIGTSRSHGIEKNGVVCDRFRVVLFLDKPATSDAEFKSAWFAAFAKWQFIDRACKDSARFFFPCKEIVSVNPEGKLFSERTSPAPQVTNKPATGLQTSYSPKKGNLSKATKDFLVDGAPDGEWHGRLFKACIDFKEQEIDIEVARRRLTAITGEWDDHDEQTLVDVYENRETKYGPREVLFINDWPVFTVDERGRVTDKPSGQAPENYRHLIKRLGYEFRYNEIDGFIYFNKRIWEEADFTGLWIKAKDLRLHGSKDLVHAVVTQVAAEASFNPVKEIIEATPWDGTDHIDQLFKTLTFKDSDQQLNLYRKYLNKWLVGVVAKLYSPGSQNLVLTFVGAQGIGKSRWLTRLSLWSNAFGEGAIDPNNKDHELRHLTHLIWHIPELDYTTGRRETGALKDYLTRDHVSVRPAYARQTRQGRSICSFAASVNAEEFLVDPTGNRRFLVLAIEAIDHQHTVNLQQVYAQAKALYEQGYKYWLDSEEIKELNLNNEQFELQDQLTALAATIQPGFDRLTTIEILEALKYPTPNRADINRFGALLKKQGIQKERELVANVRRRVWLVKSPSGSTGLRVPKPL